jgi:NAD(P)-dependent dehydrogenase (short-subunit alcohol dehydrogenase family)
MLNIDLTGKVALVVGGSRGIGASITECLCRAGATTVFTHTGNPEYAERVAELVEGLRDGPGSVKAVALDALDPSKATALVDDAVAEYGKLDMLVTNVGQNIERKAQDLTDEQWHQGIEINLSSAFYAIRPALVHMLKAKYGRMILVGSSAAYNGGGGAIEYAAAKAGIDGMMMYLSKTYARQGVLTNVIHPAVIETDLLKNRYPSEEDKKKLISQIPAGRLGKPEDIAGLVAYLGSAWGDYICGQRFLVDGGRTLFR